MDLTVNELYLLALLLVFTLPWLAWRLLRTDSFAPLVVVQIVGGILLGPGLLGAAFPQYYESLFPPAVIQNLNAVALWAVTLFVFLAGVELDVRGAWRDRADAGVAAGFALLTPLVTGALAGLVLWHWGGWAGTRAQGWQFVAGIGMASAVTALPILVLFLERLGILRLPLGQRVLRYASLDDLLIWGVLALILLDWQRLGRQALFLAAFVLVASAVRALMRRVPESDRLYLALGWLIACAVGADWSGLHFMVGAFLAGVVLDADGFGHEELAALRRHVLMVLMPVFFLSTGLRTQWELGGLAVFAAAGLLLAAAVGGKLLGVRIAGRLLGWPPGEAAVIGWLLQTKALIEIIFANILLDRGIITPTAFTALVIMAVTSTMLTIPMVRGRVADLKGIGSDATRP
jgi:Kef-type K+ transport system membrane component KefB